MSLSGGSLPGQNVVSPGDRAGLEGSTSTSYPLGRFDSRYQQLFRDLGPGRLLAAQAYRRDALTTRGDIAPFKTWLRIELSTTTVAPAAIDRTFASNPGPSPTTVLARTRVDFPLTQRPSTRPGAFALVIPYQNPYAWAGQDTLCMDMTIDGNELASGNDRNFAASLDAQQLYASGRNLQPGYRFGQGCPAPGQSRAATAVFEIRHLGTDLDLGIQARDGVPSTGSDPAMSVLLLSLDAVPFSWPPGTGCQVYGTPVRTMTLPNSNDQDGDWTGTIRVGLAPIPGFEMTAQILSLNNAGSSALSDASRMITPPPGVGVVSSRVVSASDRSAATGSVSFSVPVTEFR